MAEAKICAVDGCGKNSYARGLCSWHYKQADFRPGCAIDGCTKKVFSKGMCVAHYNRTVRNGGALSRERSANGELAAWIKDHVSFDGPGCLIWPFWRDEQGYGKSRDMCIAAHGSAPTEEHQAAHSCGNGHEGCVHPKHLRWATRLQNQAEMVTHGRSLRGMRNPNCKLTPEQVLSIRAQPGRGWHDLAEDFGVTRRTISDVLRRKSWAWLQ